MKTLLEAFRLNKNSKGVKLLVNEDNSYEIVDDDSCAIYNKHSILPMYKNGKLYDGCRIIHKFIDGTHHGNCKYIPLDFDDLGYLDIKEMLDYTVDSFKNNDYDKIAPIAIEVEINKECHTKELDYVLHRHIIEEINQSNKERLLW